MNREEKLEYLKLLEAKEIAIRNNRLKNLTFSPIQELYLCSTAKIAVLEGSNQSGKTTAGAVDIDISATGIIPDSLLGKYPEDKLRKGSYWVSSLGTKEIGEITLPKIELYLPTTHIQIYNKQEHSLTLKNGANITFKSEEQGEDKYQGAVKDAVWLDEEHKKKVWDECYMRTIAKGGYMRKTFTPLKGLSWAYQDLYLKAKRYYTSKNIHGIQEGVGIVHTLEEIKLLKDRKVEITENTTTDADENIEFYIMTIYDNTFLPDIEIQMAEKNYKDDKVQYYARILGKFTKITGRNVFNDERLLDMQDKEKKPFERGEIEDGVFTRHSKGNLVRFKEPKPGKTYVIGADIAEGLEHGDYSCAQILEKGTCEQVAVWHGHISPEEFGGILVELGKYYNNAMLAPERENHGYAVLAKIKSDFNYRRIYYSYDNDELSKSQRRGPKKLGWSTNRKTRPVMIQDLASFINDKSLVINDPQTIEELFTFVYASDGKTEAMGGCYDDRVMALAIAIQAYQRVSIPNYRDDSIDYIGQTDPYTGY